MRSPYLHSIAERLFQYDEDRSVVITDARKRDNPIVFLNSACLRMTGYEREELIGRNCRMFRGPETSDETVRILRAAIARAEPLRLDLLSYNKRGESYWTRLRMRPLLDEARRVRSFVGLQVPIRASDVIPAPYFG